MYTEYKRILVPVDGSTESKVALLKAAGVAKRNQARLDILFVINTTPLGLGLGTIEEAAIHASVERQTGYLEKAAKLAKEKTGITDVHVHARIGNPRTIIAYDFPKEFKIDLIIMGARGKGGGFREIFEGSVASFVDSHAISDVLVVRTNLENKVDVDI